MSEAPARQRLFAIVGAGPSLDLCAAEIAQLKTRGAQFLLSDSIACGFLRIWPDIKATVFTVESRRHFYLSRIGQAIDLVAYQHCHPRNLRLKPQSQITFFRLHGEAGDLPELFSPGTVLGVMLSAAANTLASASKKWKEKSIFWVLIFSISTTRSIAATSTHTCHWAIG
ncbi:MAG: hypothetical protein NZL89_06265, partial [Leptospiraceae bacterium]|nr:hypothetical protein [Leptospiraceae bacterium]